MEYNTPAEHKAMTEAYALSKPIRTCLAGLPAGSVGVVAVSGGPDSVALLRALVQESSAPMVVAHLNHQLRGDESDADEAFVRQIHCNLTAAGSFLLPLACQRLDVRGAADGDNLHDAARRLRYGWLTQVARETGAAWVATGHTADDQAETVLHRLLRGTGLRGLAGIPQQRDLAPGIKLVRPLLEVSRSDVLVFLEQLGQPFRQDSSNANRQYLRSRLRHDLLPLLASQYNPAVGSLLCRLAQQAGEAQEFIEYHAASLLASAELPRAGCILVLDALTLTVQPPLVVCEALRLLWQREGWPLGEMGYEKWRQISEIARRERPALDLPGGVRVRRVGHVMQLMQVG
jgi:tRNA(Ile)-lysidine synthase